jgi:hypothetical protein
MSDDENGSALFPYAPNPIRLIGGGGMSVRIAKPPGDG